MSEARSHQRRGKKTPTLQSQGREAARSRSAFDDDPPKRTFGRRETSGPPVNRTEP